jgi:hypothetical protein
MLWCDGDGELVLNFVSRRDYRHIALVFECDTG